MNAAALADAGTLGATLGAELAALLGASVGDDPAHAVNAIAALAMSTASLGDHMGDRDIVGSPPLCPSPGTSCLTVWGVRGGLDRATPNESAQVPGRLAPRAVPVTSQNSVVVSI